MTRRRLGRICHSTPLQAIESNPNGRASRKSGIPMQGIRDQESGKELEAPEGTQTLRHCSNLAAMPSFEARLPDPRGARDTNRYGSGGRDPTAANFPLSPDPALYILLSTMDNGPLFRPTNLTSPPYLPYARATPLRRTPISRPILYAYLAHDGVHASGAR